MPVGAGKQMCLEWRALAESEFAGRELLKEGARGGRLWPTGGTWGPGAIFRMSPLRAGNQHARTLCVRVRAHVCRRRECVHHPLNIYTHQPAVHTANLYTHIKSLYAHQTSTRISSRQERVHHPLNACHARLGTPSGSSHPLTTCTLYFMCRYTKWIVVLSFCWTAAILVLVVSVCIRASATAVGTGTVHT